MKYSTGLVAAALFAMAGVANAGVSSTATVVSDYDFRGQSLSASDPALQWSLDYAADSGFYAGAWLSNVDYGSSVSDEIELDLYAGWAGSFTDAIGWDLGIIWYTYPQSIPFSNSSASATSLKIQDYPEAYASISHGPFKLKQWYTDNYAGTDQDALYTELNASFGLPAGFTLNLHGGYNYGEYWKRNAEELLDYSAGVGYTAGHFNLGLKVAGWDTSKPYRVTSNEFNNDYRLIFSVSTTFPWASEEVAAPPPPPPPPPPGDGDHDGVTDDKDRCLTTPAGVVVDAIGCFKEITLRGVLFEFDSAALKAEARGQLDGLVQELKTRPADIVAGTTVAIEGHTDSVGSDAYNQGLSQRRADSVRQYFIDAGLSASMVVATGMGEASPADSNATAEGRANNRRVVIKATR